MIDYMTYEELYTDIGDFIQDSSAARETQIKAALNREYAKVVADVDWPHLLRVKSLTLTNASTVYLPRDVDAIKMIFDDTQKIKLEGTDTHQLYDQFSNSIGGAGVPVDISDDGDYAVKADFGAAELLNVKSSNASDTTQTVRIWGLNSSGVEQTEVVTLTGTTNAPTTLTYSGLVRVSSAETTRLGTITVTGATSTTEYLEILPNEKTIRYKRIRVSSNSTNSIILFYKKRVQRLTYANDIPEIPLSMYLFEIVVAKMYQLQRKWQPAQIHKVEAENLKVAALATIESRGQTSRQAAPSRKSTISTGPYIVVNPGT